MRRDQARRDPRVRSLLFPSGSSLTANRLAVRLRRELEVGFGAAATGQPRLGEPGSQFADASGQPLPGLAPVAMQQGRYVADVIQGRIRRKPAMPPFRYKDYGSMATIGRKAAVALIGTLKLSVLLAWLLWLFVHVMQLVQFENRLLVFVQWAFSYFTRKRGARLIAGTGRADDGAREGEP